MYAPPYGTNRALGFFSESLAWTPLFLPFMFAPLSYDCPLQSSKRITNSSSLVRIMDAKCWPVDSSASKNPIKCSLIWGFSISDNTLITTDNCSVWSGVQSRIIEKKNCLLDVIHYSRYNYCCSTNQSAQSAHDGLGSCCDLLFLFQHG